MAAPLITLSQACALSIAFNASRAIPDEAHGCFAELNTFLTVRWCRADGGPVDTPAVTRTLFGRIADFLRYHGTPLVHAYVRETGREKGEHVHAAIYVPHALWEWFKTKVTLWVAILLREPVSDAADVRPVNRWAGGLPGLVRYFIKEGTDEARERFDVAYQRNGLPVYGKRLSIGATLMSATREEAANVSHNVYPTARALAKREAVWANVVPFTPRQAVPPLVVWPPALIAAQRPLTRAPGGS
jgi:hypothetical protein